MLNSDKITIIKSGAVSCETQSLSEDGVWIGKISIPDGYNAVSVQVVTTRLNNKIYQPFIRNGEKQIVFVSSKQNELIKYSVWGLKK